jgi:hypothetical protein
LVAFGDTTFSVPTTATIANCYLGRSRTKYKTNEILKLFVEFTQPVKVTVGSGGAPYINLNINGTIRQATYIDQAPSVDQASLLFQYKIQSSDLAAATEVTLGADAVSASKTILATNQGLTYTAKDAGDAGNSITIAYVDPEGNDQELSVDVTGTDIVVNLATDETGEITSTATQIKDAIELSVAADALVDVAIVSGAGAGVVTAVAETSLTGGSDAVPGTGIVLPTNTTIKDQDATPQNATVTFGDAPAVPDLSAVTVN